MMTPNDPIIGPLDLRQLLLVRSPVCCRGMLLDLQRIHAVTRQMFSWVLVSPVNSLVILERMLDSVVRQIEAARNLQPQLMACDAGENVQTELANLLEYLESVRATIAGRLGAR
jgi:hypothetical protein